VSPAPKSFRCGSLFLAFFAAACSSNSSPGGLTITSQPPTRATIREPYLYQVVAKNALGASAFVLTNAPAAMTIDPDGLVSWLPAYPDLGTHPVEIEVSDAKVRRRQSFSLRVDQGLLLGTGLSWLGHTGSGTPLDYVDHVSGHDPWGSVIAFQTAWRDPGDRMSEIPGLASTAMVDARTYGFTPTVGIGWTDGQGNPDLTSDSEPANNSWSNQETRAEFLQMAGDFAALYQPPYLFLGNETNVYYATHTAAEWADWISEFEACYDAIHAVSRDTLVFTVFQLEFMKGLGAKTGSAPPASWDLIADHDASGKIDAIGFTTYPYLEYDTVAYMPPGYYQEIASYWTGPVVFSEIGWIAADSGPYLGSESEQVAFLDAFFDGTQDLDLVDANWLFLHDWDQQALVPAFANIGLRDNLASFVRLADASWQAQVALREGRPRAFAWRKRLPNQPQRAQR